MKISEARRLQLLSWASDIMQSRPCDLKVGTHIERWMIWPKSQWRNIYIHRFVGDDLDQALHDHEPDNISILLEESYIEHFHVEPRERELHDGKIRFKRRQVVRKQGDIIFRFAETPHCTSMPRYINTASGPVALGFGSGGEIIRPAISLFIQGPRRRRWGFHCVQGWKHWKDYIDENKSYGDRSGQGCG